MRWSQEDFNRFQQGRAPEAKKKPKYRNHRVVWNGDEFDSKRELDVFHALQAARMAGQFRAVVRQVSMRLPGTKRRIRIDFMCVEPNGNIRWLDAKGFEGAASKLKRAAVFDGYGITIEPV